MFVSSLWGVCSVYLYGGGVWVSLVWVSMGVYVKLVWFSIVIIVWLWVVGVCADKKGGIKMVGGLYVYVVVFS